MPSIAITELGISRTALVFDQLSSQPNPYFWLVLLDGTVVNASDVEDGILFCYCLVFDPATNELLFTLTRTNGTGEIDILDDSDPIGAMILLISSDEEFTNHMGTFRYELWNGTVGEIADRQLLATGVLNIRPTALPLVE